MDKGSGWKGPEVPEWAKKNILEILADAGENGIEIADFSHKYFAKFDCSIYIQRYGFKDWAELLKSPMFVPHVTFFENGTKVRESRFTSSNTDLTVPKDLKTYEPVVNVGQIDENGDEKPVVHAVNILRHVKNS